MHPALPISKQVLSNSQESRGSITHNDELGRQKLSLQTPCTLSCCVLRVMMMPLRSPGVSCLASVPSQVPAHPLTAEMRWEEKCLIPCKPCSAIMTTFQYQHCFSKNSKHIPVVDIVKEINSTSDKTSTCMNLHPKFRRQFPMRINRGLLEQRCVLKVTL